MLLTSKSLISCKVEATEGVDSSPTPAANGLSASRVNVAFNPTMVERDEDVPFLSPTGRVIAQRYGTVTFTTPIKGSGSPGVLPREDPLYRACGMSPAIAAGSSVVYTPNSGFATGSNTASIYAYLGADTANAGARHIFRACRGNVEFIFDTADYGRANWTMMGFFTSPSATPNITDGIYDVNASGATVDLSTVPPPCINCTFDLPGLTGNSSGKIISRLTFNKNNDVQPRPDIGGGNNTDQGIYGFIVRRQRPGGTMNPEYVSRSAYDWFYKAAVQSAGTLAFQIGATAGNIFKLNAPYMTVGYPAWDDRNGVRILNIDYLCVTAQTAAATGDDEFSIVLS